MADMIKFYKGALANLPASGTNGALYITTDEGAIYLGTGVGMKRLGDFVQVDAVANLPASANTYALYYCVAENVLAKWSGTEWKQVNKQPTKDELKVLLGLDTEGVVTKAIAAAKKAGDDAGVAAANAQKDVDALEAYVGTIPDGYTEETVIAYINKKAEETLNAASGGSSESAASVKAALDTEIARAKAAEEANAKAAADAQTAADNAQTTADGKTTMAEVEAKGYATKEEAKGYADAKNNAIAAAQKAGDDAQADVDALELKVGTVAEGKTVVGLISDAQTAADNAQDAVDTLAGKVGTVPSDKTVVQMISDAQTAATYDDKEVRGLISDNADAIDAIEKDYLKKADKEALQSNIDTVSGKVDTLNGNAETEGSVDYKIAQAVAAIMENPDDTMNSINELVNWIDDHAEDALELSNQVTTNKNDIATLNGLVGTTGVAAQIEAAITEALKVEGKDKYALATELAAAIERIVALEAIDHDHSNKTVLDGITAEKVAAWDKAEENAEAHADSLNSAMNTRVLALEAIDHDHTNKDELDLIVSGDKAKWDDAYAKRHEHSNKTVLDGITSDKVATWDTVTSKAAQTDLDGAITRIGTAEGKITALETESAKHALKTEVEAVETALNTYKTDNDAAVSLKANATDVYAKTETYTKGEVEALLTWGDF